MFGGFFRRFKSEDDEREMIFNRNTEITNIFLLFIQNQPRHDDINIIIFHFCF